MKVLYIPGSFWHLGNMSKPNDNFKVSINTTDLVVWADKIVERMDWQFQFKSGHCF
jgi:hypothetical protein